MASFDAIAFVLVVLTSTYLGPISKLLADCGDVPLNRS